jgi:hypothetical protein
VLETHQILTVAEDLEYLKRQWSDGAAGDDLRRGSAILRRLLVENEILAAWKQLGLVDQPKVVSVDLHLMVGDDLSRVVAAVAGGARVAGGYFAGAVLEGPFDSPDQAPVRASTQSEIERVFRLKEYVEDPCAVAQGEVVSRREVVKYFANHLGGVHLSRRARVKEEPMIRRLERIQSLFEIGGLEGLHHEILAIGQVVSGSQDVQRLVSAIRGSIR